MIIGEELLRAYAAISGILGFGLIFKERLPEKINFICNISLDFHVIITLAAMILGSLGIITIVTF